ncbi:hypothetical protein KIN20_034136 [Parelaphostrongylus tenuis]|uniref:Uncharacterized protein n=1 Tax=Parelaphostrongylus tenuis TaxID=148309 RepID=A0AAD5R9U7_PARTN|nr:hypothetical protein KIN20_034136 [Parelaphostrongylus tenuis]
MLPPSCSTTRTSDIKECVKKAQRDAMVDLVISTIDLFLSQPCAEPQVLTIRVPDLNVTVAEVTSAEASKMVNNPHYDKLLEAGENKKRVHTACAAARQFLVEHIMAKNPFPPLSHKTHGVSAVQPKHGSVDLSYKDDKGIIQRRHAACVLRASGLLSSSSNSSSSVASGSSYIQVTSSKRSSHAKSKERKTRDHKY